MASLDALLAALPTSPEYTNKLAVCLYTFSLKRKGTDFKFQAGNTTAYCHSLILCLQNQYFDELCSRGVREVTLEPCVGPEEDGLALLQMLRHLYLRTMELTVDIVEPVIKSAKDFQHDDLLKDCEKYMVQMLNERNFQQLADVAQRYGLRTVSEAVMQFQSSQIQSNQFHGGQFQSGQFQSSQFQSGQLQSSQLQSSQFQSGQLQSNQLQSSQFQSSQSAAVSLPSVDPHVPETNADFYSVCASDDMMIITGDQDPALSNVNPFNFTTPEWSEQPDLPRPRDSHLIPFQSDKQAMKNTVIIGGTVKGNYGSEDIMYLDNNEKANPITQATMYKDVAFYSVCSCGDEMIISGGCDVTAENSLSTVHLFNFTTLEWSKLQDLPHPRDVHASLLTRQKLFIMFGVRREYGDIVHWYQEVIVLDLATGSWSALKNSPLTLDLPSVAVVNQDIFVMGGATSDNVWSKKTMRYNIPCNEWFSCQDMPPIDAYAVYSTVVSGNRIFTLMPKDFLVYDTQVDGWTRLTSPLVPSYWCSMVLLKDTLLAMGGHEKHLDAKNPHDRLQSYDLRTGQWSLLEETMPKPLSWHTAIVLPLRL